MQQSYALITGSSGGIGLEMARIAATKKYNLILTARSTDKLEEIKKELSVTYGIKVICIPLDLSLQQCADKLYRTVKESSIIPEILINNAGFGYHGNFYKTSWEKENDMLNLNIIALTHLTKLFIQDMIHEGHGMVMNVSSTAAFLPLPYLSVYAASKSYVLSFSEALHAELKGTGISVTTLCPGPTKTGFEKKAEFENANLFNKFPVATAKKVAQKGFDGMLKKKTLVIPGGFNKLNYISSIITPRFITKRIAKKIMQ